MAAVACGALFKALLAALGGHKQPEKAAAVNQAGRWRRAALRGYKKNTEASGTPPTPIKIVAGFEPPVADPTAGYPHGYPHVKCRCALGAWLCL